MCIADESSLSESLSRLGHAASSTSQQSALLSQPRASRVTWDDEEVTTQLPIQSRQLSPSQSALSQIAESTQDQAELVSADSDTSVSLEADLPNLASAAEEAAESSDDDYGNEFEADEPLVDESPDSSPAEAPSKTIYDNPLGSESSESALDTSNQDVSDHVAPTHGAILVAQAAPHETHVTTQLAVSEQGSVKLNYGLEEEDQSSADVQHSLPSTQAAAGHMEPHGSHMVTKVMASADDSVKVQSELVTAPMGEEDAQAAGLLAGQGTSLQQPFTPMARGSVFSASANLSDNVDIFSKTQPAPKAAAAAATAATLEEADSDLASGYGQHLARVRSGLNRDSDYESGRDLTPSYRRQEGRSLQQAVDNEQPFGTAWRNQMLMASDAKHVCASVTAPDAIVAKETGPASGTEAVRFGANPTLAPKPASQAPSRQSSLGFGSKLGHHDRQPSLSTAAALMPKAEQLEPSTAGTAGSLNAPAKQHSLRKFVASGTADTLSSHNSLAPEFSLSKLASGALSKQPSYLNLPPSGASSRRSSFSVRLERETSQVLIPRQISNAVFAAEQPTAAVSRMTSLGGSRSPLLSPEVSDGSLAAHTAASEAAPRVPSRQPSFSKPASLSRQASQVSRQASIEAAAAAEAASVGPSRQPSFSRQVSLSRQSSQMPLPSSSNQAAAKAASNAPSRKASFSRPVSASGQGSQLVQPQLSGSGGTLLLSRSSSRLPSRQASISDSVQSASLSNAPPMERPSAAAHATAESSHDMSYSSHVQSHDQPVAELKPVSRTHSVFSQPQRTNSLEVMHRQMSISRQAPAVEHDATAVATGPTAATQASAVMPGKATRVIPAEVELTGNFTHSVEMITYLMLKQ